MIRSLATIALRKKYGKYLPHQRSNVDQVPLSLDAYGEDKDWVLLDK